MKTKNIIAAAVAISMAASFLFSRLPLLRDISSGFRVIILTVLIAGLVVPAMPYLLSFAAGAMLYVVVEELIPEMSAGEHSNIGVISFAVGFSLMMALDVALG